MLTKELQQNRGRKRALHNEESSVPAMDTIYAGEARRGAMPEDRGYRRMSPF